MPRRKRKKPHKQFRDANKSNTHRPSFETSLEEDLRQQRLRQKERAKQEEPNLSTTVSQEDEDDTENSIPFEKTPLKRQDLISRGLATSRLEDVPSLPALSFGFVRNESPLLNPFQRQKLGNTWHSKYLYESVRINRMGSHLFCRKMKWRSHTLPDGTYCTTDMICKHHLHPSARTLDVATFGDRSQLPIIATLVGGGFGIFSTPRVRQDRFLFFRGLPAHSIRMHEKFGRCGTIVRRDRDSLYKFHCYALPDASSYFDVDVQAPVNDFCFGNELVLFACPRYYAGTTLSPIFLTLEDGREGLLRTLNIQNFPQSDALRVEMTSSRDKFVAFGHRNGQTSLLDLRQSHSTCSILQHLGESSAPLGGATDLSFLPNQQVVVKRAFGSCQLHDLRRICSSNQTPARSRTSSVVHHMMVPPDQILSTASATCNGLAVDPLEQTTLMAPYIDSNNDACLGLWSLCTGLFIGSKLLMTSNKEDSVHVELCQKTTAAFLHPKASDRSRYGVWLKCGRFSKSQQNGKTGSLYHLTFPGSLK